MKIKPVKNLLFNAQRDPEVMRRVNMLAKREQLKPVSALRRFLLEKLPKGDGNNGRKTG